MHHRYFAAIFTTMKACELFARVLYLLPECWNVGSYSLKWLLINNKTNQTDIYRPFYKFNQKERNYLS